MPPKLLIDALGTVVQIDLQMLTDADAEAVRNAWRDALAPVPEPVEGSVVERAKRDETPRTSRSPSVPEPVEGPTVTAIASLDRALMLESFSQHVTLAALNARSGDLWMLHAAGVAADDGRVVVLVGPSGRGKTTAARTLGETFGYVSDETVAIDDDGRVWPYRKPLSVVVPGAPKAQHAPSELGLRPLPDAALRLAAIVLLDRHDDAPDEATVEDVDLGDALEDLVAQSSYLTAMPAPLHSIAALAASAGGIRRVTYRDAASLRPVVNDLLAITVGRAGGEAATPAGRVGGEAATPAGRVGGEAAVPAVGRVGGEAAVSRPPEPGDASSPRYSRTPFVDVLDLTEPDRLVVLQAGHADAGMLHVLAGVAPALWRAADAASRSYLTDAALAAYGRPDGDASALVEAALAELVAVGVLGTDRWWRIRDDAAWVDHGDRVVVLSLADPGGSPLALEGSAALIWRALGERVWRTTDAVIDGVSAQVEVARLEVEGDVAAFLESLATTGLIVRA